MSSRKKSDGAIERPAVLDARRWFVYLIVNQTGRSYVGATFDVSPARRLGEHNGSPRGAKATRGKGPWQLAYAEHIPEGKRACLSREWHLKRERALRRGLATAWKKAARQAAALAAKSGAQRAVKVAA